MLRILIFWFCAKFNLTGRQRNKILKFVCIRHSWKNGVCTKCNTKIGH